MSQSERTRESITFEDLMGTFADHCKRRGVAPGFQKTVEMRAQIVSQQPGASPQKVVEAVVQLAKSFPDLRLRDVMFEFAYLHFPHLVAGLYTPRVSTQEEILTAAVAGNTENAAMAAIAENAGQENIPTVPMKALGARDVHRAPTAVDLSGAQGVDPRKTLVSARNTVAYIEDDNMASPGGIADVLERERKLGEERAARDKAARELAEQQPKESTLAHRRTLETIDPDEQGQGQEPAEAEPMFGDEPPTVVLGKRTPSASLPVAPQVDLDDIHGRATLFNEEALAAAQKEAQLLSGAVLDNDEPTQDRPTLPAPEPVRKK